MKQDNGEILNELTSLYSGYIGTFRASIHQSKVNGLKKKDVDIDDYTIRESLLEHVGHLPITAIALYPHIKDDEVNLGEALIMLAIHDIGELNTGDKMLFQKKFEDKKYENEVAQDLVHPLYKEYYEDAETQKTKSGKFAKSIDKLVADILELVLDPEISRRRYERQAGLAPEEIVPAKRAKKMKYMEWNPFLTGFYDYLLQELDHHLNPELY